MATEETTETIEPEVEAAPAPKRRKGEKRFELIPDGKGASIHGGLFLIYIVASLVMTRYVEQGTVWWYAFYFIACFVTFQAVTVVGRHCMHLTPKSVVRVDVAGKTVRLTRRNGNVTSLTREIDYAGRKNMVVIEGKTDEKVKFSEVLRKGAFPEGEFETLMSALKKFG